MVSYRLEYYVKKQYIIISIKKLEYLKYKNYLLNMFLKNKIIINNQKNQVSLN